ncbi:Peroxisomal membrane protein 11B-like protein, partial [Leptotrombidium deliense]
MSKCSENWNRWTRVNSQTAGLYFACIFCANDDCFIRLLQYSCQLISSFDGYSPEKQNVSKLKQLETILSLTQKLMRFGRSAETLQSALNTISISDPTIRFTVTLSRISSSLYLFSDHVLWLARVGLISANSEKWSNLSYRFWLYSILMNLVRDFYEIRSLMKHYALFNPRCLANRRV